MIRLVANGRLTTFTFVHLADTLILKHYNTKHYVFIYESNP